MPRNFKYLHFQPEKISRGGFLNEKIRFDWFDFEFESEAAEEFAAGDHRCSQRMTTDFAAKPRFDSRKILDMIDMTVRQEQEFEVDIAGLEPVASASGRVEKNPALRSFKQITIGFENAAAKTLVNHLSSLYLRPGYG